MVYKIINMFVVALTCKNHVSLKSQLFIRKTACFQLCDDVFSSWSKEGLDSLFRLKKEEDFYKHMKEHFILQFITNIQNQHRYVVFTGQEEHEKL